MSWVKLSDEWVESDTVEALGSDAAMLHLTALAYSSRHATDGYLPRRAIRKLWQVDNLDAAVKALEESGEWEPAEDGWTLTNWADHIMSAAEIKKRREQTKERVQNFRHRFEERTRRHAEGDHSMCDRCSAVLATKGRNAVTNAVSNGSPDPTRPDPTRREGRGRGEVEDEGGSAGASPPSPRPLREGVAVHNWQPDHSGLSCAACGMPQRHQLHTDKPLSGPAAWGRPASRVIVRGGKK